MDDGGDPLETGSPSSGARAHRPVLFSETPVKTECLKDRSPPAALTAVLESISSRMEMAGDWERAAALSSSAEVVAEVQDALAAAAVKPTDVTAPELLTALLSCFAT